MEMPQNGPVSRACTFERVWMFVLGFVRVRNCEMCIGIGLGKHFTREVKIDITSTRRFPRDATRP